MEVTLQPFPGGTAEEPVRTAGVPTEIRTGIPPEYKPEPLSPKPTSSLSHLNLLNVTDQY
jgi:hypothetical protein